MHCLGLVIYPLSGETCWLTQGCQLSMLFGSGIRKSPFGTGKKHTVDGRNPAPVDMVNIPLSKGFYTSQVVVWDFFHQQYQNHTSIKKSKFARLSKKYIFKGHFAFGFVGSRTSETFFSFKREFIYTPGTPRPTSSRNGWLSIG